MSQLGREAEDVRDVGLRGRPDEAVIAHAMSKGLTVVTADLGFGNEVRFPPESHFGVIVARFPNEVSTANLVAAVLSAIDSLPDELIGCIVIVEPDRVRLRRKAR